MALDGGGNVAILLSFKLDLQIYHREFISASSSITTDDIRLADDFVIILGETILLLDERIRQENYEDIR